MKVVIEMEQGWHWWPIDEADPGPLLLGVSKTWGQRSIEIDQEVFERYKRVSAEHQQLQELFEHLYRHQQGLEPFLQSPFHPDYKEE